jgi:tripartite-type tricarboxylate transporter receptor subunit TctC
MRIKALRFTFAAALLAAGAALPSLATAAYPDRPIRLVLPFPPGGPSDIVARMVSQRLGEGLGQQVVVDNRGGAAGVIAVDIVKNASPDGYTVLQATVGVLSILPSLYPKLSYSPTRDFSPVSLLTETPYVLVINPKLPAKNIAELVKYAKAHPRQLNIGSGGVGTANHLSGELFKLSAGIDAVHVPYKGSGIAMNDLMAGQIHMMFINLLPATPHVKAGRLRALGISSAKRSAASPQIPTVAESGFPGFSSTSWHGIVVPAKTPAAVITRLHQELSKVTHGTDLNRRLESQGTDVIGSTPAEFTKVIADESAKWGKVIRTAGIKPD